jgi:GTPase
MNENDLEADTSAPSHRAGFVSIVGRPNAGKSTLLNALLGQKLSIVSPRPQTTRHRILGILSADHYQLVFVDTPGVIVPRVGLHRAMMGAVGSALADAEVVLWVVSPDDDYAADDPLLVRLRKLKAPVVLALNKADTRKPEQLITLLDSLAALLPVAERVILSATETLNLEGVIQAAIRHLPEAPPYFDRDQVTDQPERFFVAEIIREKVFLQFREEIPYGIEVGIVQYEEASDPVRIEAEIHVAKASHKGMLIGKGGAALTRLGKAARLDIETFIGQRVFLNLYVRVAEGWVDHPGRLRGFGYDPSSSQG